jgi:hypothetical protein
MAQYPIARASTQPGSIPAPPTRSRRAARGTTTIAHEDSPDKLVVVQTLKTERGARTMALDPSTHRIYVAAARYEPPAAGAPPNARPQIVPNSMHLLVYGIDGK